MQGKKVELTRVMDFKYNWFELVFLKKKSREFVFKLKDTLTVKRNLNTKAATGGAP